MAEKLNDLRAGFALALGAVSAALGWFGWLMVLYAICMAADWITGSAAAMYNGEWSSGKARAGIWHKVGSVIIVMVAAGADLLIGLIINHLPGIVLPFTYSVMLCPIVTVWYIAAELGSIAENAVRLGAPRPKFLSRILAVIEDAVDTAGEGIVPEDHKDGK